MRKNEIVVLCELLKNSRISDKKLGKKLNIAQSTVSRIRHKLEKSIIKLYIGVPDLQPLGMISVLIFARCTEPIKESHKKIKDFVAKNPTILFAGKGEGMMKTVFFATLHSSIQEFMSFIKKFREEGKSCVDDIEWFFLEPKNIFKDLDFATAIRFILQKKRSKTDYANA